MQFSYDVHTVAKPESATVEAKEGWHKELDAYMGSLDLEETGPGTDGEPLRARLSDGKNLEVMMPDR